MLRGVPLRPVPGVVLQGVPLDLGVVRGYGVERECGVTRLPGVVLLCGVPIESSLL